MVGWPNPAVKTDRNQLRDHDPRASSVRSPCRTEGARESVEVVKLCEDLLDYEVVKIDFTVILLFRICGEVVFMKAMNCLCLMAALCVVGVGCGGGASDAPKLVPVEGKLMIDGQAAGAGISVAFVPDGSKGTKGPQSSGVTSADGTFVLHGTENKPGAVVGHHKVTVNCPLNVMEGSSADGSDPSTTSKCAIAEALRSSATTTISVEVKAKAEENRNVLIEATSK